MDRGVCQAAVHGLTHAHTVKEGGHTGTLINEYIATAVSVQTLGKRINLLQSWPSRMVKNWAIYLQLPNPITGASLPAQRQRIHLQCGRYERGEFSPRVEKIPWKRAWQPTPVILPGEFHGQRSLVGYNP